MEIFIQKQTDQEETECRETWHREFTWLPRRVSSEKIIWLKWCETRWHGQGIWSKEIGDEGNGWGIGFLS